MKKSKVMSEVIRKIVNKIIISDAFVSCEVIDYEILNLSVIEITCDDILNYNINDFKNSILLFLYFNVKEKFFDIKFVLKKGSRGTSFTF